MNEGADMTATATRIEPTQGVCMYCHRTDVKVLRNGTLDGHLIKGTARECEAPLYTQPGTLQEHLSRALGLDTTPRLDVLLEKVACLVRNDKNAHRRLDELGVSDGGFAKLSVTGRIEELVQGLRQAAVSV